METIRYAKEWNSTSGHVLPKGIPLSTRFVTFDQGSLIRQLLYFYAEKQDKCRASNMQITNAPRAALTTVESESRSSTQSSSKAHVVSNVSVHTFSFNLKVLHDKDIGLFVLIVYFCGSVSKLNCSLICACGFEVCVLVKYNIILGSVI